MKRSILTTLTLMMLLAIGGCSKRALLSDEELAQVFHDAFLANSYVSTDGLKLDSLRLYDPIFEKYGYTADDVQYTIGNFSKRKSARLGDVVERAIAMLEEEGKRLDREVAILDTVNNIVVRRATHEIYRDTLIELRSKRDSSKLKIVIEDLERGDYNISFDYLVDSLDTNKSYTTKYWLERVKNDSTTTKYSINNAMLSKNQVSHYSRTLSVHSDNNRLVLHLADLDKSKAKHHATFKNLVITHIPPVEAAQESIFNEIVNIRIFADEKILTPSKDRL